MHIEVPDIRCIYVFRQAGRTISMVCSLCPELAFFQKKRLEKLMADLAYLPSRFRYCLPSKSLYSKTWFLLSMPYENPCSQTTFGKPPLKRKKKSRNSYESDSLRGIFARIQFKFEYSLFFLFFRPESVIIKWPLSSLYQLTSYRKEHKISCLRFNFHSSLTSCTFPFLPAGRFIHE